MRSKPVKSVLNEQESGVEFFRVKFSRMEIAGISGLESGLFTL